MVKINNYFMYVLLCEDNSLYTGFTTNVEKRFLKHRSGRGAKYTRSHRPIKILFKREFESKHDALSAEYAFKQLSRSQKIAYLAQHGILIH
ncbi:GIY-YIG nuclease family protein [Lentilactobacillus diolivorans]|uniref:GIY-YIG nuclease family protein n=1 Tax=Lentilactobacillus diolivorans TaxID=179838 RepID=UPI0024695D24|nr:GIY-YIG nuclease family protein [Lentilactobacillus diolivorans]MDH5104431.1 GIY-YIG nuclease family protein [Lentilactobacillus diolivorans]